MSEIGRRAVGDRVPRTRWSTAQLTRVALVAMLVIIGGVCLGLAVAAQEQPPQPHVAVGEPSITPGPPVRSAVPKAPRPVRTPRVLPHSEPVSLDIPAIDVHSTLIRLGLNPDRTVEVPPLDRKDSVAGWYDGSVAPGDLGPAVILGHVDSARFGPAVFFRLGQMRTGERIVVHRRDGSTAVFVVRKVASFPKSRFPTTAIYGPADTAALRLITCGGTFDAQAGSYENNIVVFATLKL